MLLSMATRRETSFWNEPKTTRPSHGFSIGIELELDGLVPTILMWLEPFLYRYNGPVDLLRRLRPNRLLRIERTKDQERDNHLDRRRVVLDQRLDAIRVNDHQAQGAQERHLDAIVQTTND